jgi:hypothetical protein
VCPRGLSSQGPISRCPRPRGARLRGLPFRGPNPIGLASLRAHLPARLLAGLPPGAGHLVVAVAGLIDLCTATPADPWPLVGMIIGLPLLAILWYRIAVVATDDWAGAVRALVNLGRQPLASSLGLELPLTLARERTMWSATVSLVQGQSAPDPSALDEFRAPENARPPGDPGPGGAPSSTDQAPT